MTNELELEELLSRRGFEIVVPSTLSFDQQIEAFGSAELVVAPHGAGMSNIVFCSRSARILELTSDAYVNSCYVNLSRALGLRHTLAVFHGSGCGTGVRHKESWTVDLKSVESALAQAEYA